MIDLVSDNGDVDFLTADISSSSSGAVGYRYEAVDIQPTNSCVACLDFGDDEDEEKNIKLVETVIERPTVVGVSPKRSRKTSRTKGQKEDEAGPLREVNFVVLGNPRQADRPRIMGSKSSTGTKARLFSPHKKDMQAFTDGCKHHFPSPCLSGPLSVSLLFVFASDATHDDGLLHTCKPGMQCPPLYFLLLICFFPLLLF